MTVDRLFTKQPKRILDATTARLLAIPQHNTRLVAVFSRLPLRGEMGGCIYAGPVQPVLLDVFLLLHVEFARPEKLS